MEKFYVTTPIYYVTAKPHIGHAFATIVADVLARWNRLLGKDVFFLVGTDEHGTKIEKAAREAGKTPKEFVDEVANTYIEAWRTLNISFDKFIRTTDEEHEKAVSEFTRLVWDNKDIYKGVYEGWYCVPDETFIADFEVKEGKCPECGRDVQRIKEDAYFFALSSYKEDLLKIFDENPEFVKPAARSNEILNRLKGEIRDLDITRKSVKWGIPFQLDKEQTVYVWFDALINYISALGWPNESKFTEFWPADVHVVGKEITWFHAAIWPAMLLSADIDLPKTILSHGWWTVDGKKMSKSLGNVVNPIEISKKYSVDALRYFLIKEKSIWEDGDFSEKELVSRINGELLADLGNLVARTLTLAEKFKGKIEGKQEIEDKLNMNKIKELFESYDVNSALNEIWTFVRSVNKYINDTEPWKLTGARLGAVLNNSLEALRIISILLSPFIPSTSDSIQTQLGIKLGSIDDCKFGTFNGKVKRGTNLFNKITV